MTANDHWQRTLLLQCSLPTVRQEFVILCVELCRCYARNERPIYHVEDDRIGENLYLAAFRQQQEKREREEMEGQRCERELAGRRASARDEVGGIIYSPKTRREK